MRTWQENIYVNLRDASASLTFFLLVGAWIVTINLAPPDAQQGAVYKILFVHVPAAACALGLCSLGLFITSILTLRHPEAGYARAGRAWVETGLIFTLVTLLTGSIWGKPTWGTWWTWDARLTTTLLLAILQGAYLLLYQSLEPGPQRARICAALGLVLVLDVPIIYKSVSWWRTLHQEASLIEQSGRTMDPTMLQYLLVCLAFALLFCMAVWRLRVEVLRIEAQLEDLSYGK